MNDQRIQIGDELYTINEKGELVKLFTIEVNFETEEDADKFSKVIVSEQFNELFKNFKEE